MKAIERHPLTRGGGQRKKPTLKGESLRGGRGPLAPGTQGREEGRSDCVNLLILLVQWCSGAVIYRGDYIVFF